MTATIVHNVGGRGSCSICGDTGYVTLNVVRKFDGHEYGAWCAACRWCEAGTAVRVRWAKQGYTAPDYTVDDVEPVGVAA